MTESIKLNTPQENFDRVDSSFLRSKLGDWHFPALVEKLMLGGFIFMSLYISNSSYPKTVYSSPSKREVLS